MAKKQEEKTEIRLQPLNHRSIKVPIIGKTPLIMDKMSDEVLKGILEKQTGIVKSGRKQLRDVKKEVAQAIHRTGTGKIGFPIAGFKKGMMEVSSFVGDKWFSKKLVSGAIRIINAEDGLIPIKFKRQDVLQHRVGSNIKFSPQFHDWSCELVIQFDANNISATDIVTCINHAGFYVGVGMWRPKGGGGGTGDYGCYEVKGSGNNG